MMHLFDTEENPNQSVDEFIASLRGVTQSPSNANLYYATCPKCSENKLGVRKDTGFYWCFRKSSCGFRGYLNADAYVESSFVETDWDFMGVEDDGAEPYAVLPLIPRSDLERLKPLYDHPYLRGRGFTEWDPIQYPIASYNKMPTYVFFILHQQGRPVGYIGRNTKSEDFRYYNMPGLRFNHLLYGDHAVYSKTVIVTEGILSAINVNMHLLRLGIYDVTAVATFGARISPQQVWVLRGKGVRDVYLWHEIDHDGGSERYERSGNRLAKHFNVFRAEFRNNDPGDIDKDDVERLLEDRVAWEGAEELVCPV